MGSSYNRIVILGSSSVGKTSIFSRLTGATDSYNEACNPKIGAQYRYITSPTNNISGNIGIWKIDGEVEEDLKKKLIDLCSVANGIIIVFDVSVESTFVELQSCWCRYADANNTDANIILVANKKENGAISSLANAAREFAISKKFKFMECDVMSPNFITKMLQEMSIIPLMPPKSAFMRHEDQSLANLVAIFTDFQDMSLNNRKVFKENVSSHSKQFTKDDMDIIMKWRVGEADDASPLTSTHVENPNVQNPDQMAYIGLRNRQVIKSGTDQTKKVRNTSASRRKKSQAATSMTGASQTLSPVRENSSLPISPLRPYSAQTSPSVREDHQTTFGNDIEFSGDYNNEIDTNLAVEVQELRNNSASRGKKSQATTSMTGPSQTLSPLRDNSSLPISPRRPYSAQTSPRVREDHDDIEFSAMENFQTASGAHETGCDGDNIGDPPASQQEATEESPRRESSPTRQNIEAVPHIVDFKEFNYKNWLNVDQYKHIMGLKDFQMFKDNKYRILRLLPNESSNKWDKCHFGDTLPAEMVVELDDDIVCKEINKELVASRKTRRHISMRNDNSKPSIYHFITKQIYRPQEQSKEDKSRALAKQLTDMGEEISTKDEMFKQFFELIDEKVKAFK